MTTQPSNSAKVIMLNQIAIMTALRSIIPAENTAIHLALNMCLEETMRFSSPEVYDQISKIIMDALKSEAH